MSIRSLLCLAVLSFFTGGSVASDSVNSFPRIWVSDGDKQEILENIKNHQWAASLQHQLEQRVQTNMNMCRILLAICAQFIPTYWP